MSTIQGAQVLQERFVRSKRLAEILGTSQMTLHRWRKDEALAFPKPTVINKIPYFDTHEIIAWMKERVVNRAEKKVA